MMKTDLDSMGVDLSLAPAPETRTEPAKAAPTPPVAKVAPVSEVIPSSKQAHRPEPEPLADQMAKPTELENFDLETRCAREQTPVSPKETDKKAQQKATGTVAEARPTAAAESAELTEADIAVLQDVLEVYRAAKNLIAAVSNLISGGMKRP
jgi:hypothetical protein